MILLYQGGLEIPCNVKVTIADTEKGHVLINAYSELVSKLYCKPEEDMSARIIFVPESNVNLQPRRRKATEKKTPLSNSEHKNNVHKNFKSPRGYFKPNAMISIFLVNFALTLQCSISVYYNLERS